MSLSVFGERVKKLRKQRKFTLNELGAKLKVAPSTLSGYENGFRSPPLGIVTGQNSEDG